MKHTASLLIILFLLSAFAEAHEGSKKCTCRRHLPHLCAKHFGRVWKIESESDRYTARFMNDTLELIAPKGLTLWHKKKMKGNVTITYFARVMDEGHPEDRLSDLNCFWMASDPKARSVFGRMKQRKGIFTNCYALQLYYMGYGGNSNTTTRFRRYDGNEKGIDNPSERPAVLKEYTDSAHLLRPNRWYYIVLKRTGKPHPVFHRRRVSCGLHRPESPDGRLVRFPHHMVAHTNHRIHLQGRVASPPCFLTGRM